MLYFYSRMSIRPLTALLTFGLLLLTLFAAPALTSERPVSDKHVRARLDLKIRQNAAIHQLINMSGGSLAFDARSARELRRFLIDSSKKIPRRFRKQRHDHTSHARAEIWSNWDDFEARAAQAERAAKGLKTRSLTSLRASLPALIHSCQSCHDRYRSEVNEFTTH